MRFPAALPAVLLAGLALGCSPEAEMTSPAPVALTAEDTGHFCRMTVVDHPGPKAQLHYAGGDAPFWFTQVRDALAFDRMPEEAVRVTTVYVSDMGAAPSWERPGADNWIDMRSAHFVVGSERRGGMGAPELVPFADPKKAAAFAADHGGTVIAYAEITDDMVLGPVDVDPAGLAAPVGSGGDPVKEGS